MPAVCVLTPTFNRGPLLKGLFDSLCAQREKDFEWLIVDDGSTDDTEKVAKAFAAQADFPVVYQKKENGGKHTALNFGYAFIHAPLTFIVDSDDTLTPDAINVIKTTYEKYKNERDLCGFSFLKIDPEGNPLSAGTIPSNGIKETFVQCRINRRLAGDMAEAWYTHCLQEFPFPVFAGERFLGEDVVWIRLAQKYKMRFFNDRIYVADYRPDGLTVNRRKHNLSSPNGCMVRAETFLEAGAIFPVRVKSMLQYYIYGRFAGFTVPQLYDRSKHKLLFVLLAFPGQILYQKWKRAYCV